MGRSVATASATVPAQGQCRSQSQLHSSAGADDAAGDGEQPAAAASWVRPHAAGPVNARVWVQASRSAASSTSSSQIWFAAVVQRQVASGRCLWRSGSGPRRGPGGGAAAPGRRAAHRRCWWRTGDPPAVGVGQPQLRAGMRSFAAGDHPHPGAASRGQVEQAGQLGDVCARRAAPVAVVGRGPRRPGSRASGVSDRHCHAGRTDEYCSPGQRGGEEGVGASRRCRRGPAPGRAARRAAGASARSRAVMWSAALFAFALPGRSSPASASPVPPSPWSRNASTGRCPKPRLNVGCAPSFSECGSDQRGVDVHRHRPVPGGPPPAHAPAPGPCACAAAIASSDVCVHQRPGRRSPATPSDRRAQHRTDQLAVTQHPDVGQAVPAEREHVGELGYDPARVVHRPQPAPRRERGPQLPFQPTDPRGLSNRTSPPRDTSPSPVADTCSRCSAVVRFTYRVPSRLRTLCLRQAAVSQAGQALR